MNAVAEGLLPARDRRIAQRADRVRVALSAPERDGARLGAARYLGGRDAQLAVARPREPDADVGRAGVPTALKRSTSSRCLLADFICRVTDPRNARAWALSKNCRNSTCMCPAHVALEILGCSCSSIARESPVAVFQANEAFRTTGIPSLSTCVCPRDETNDGHARKVARVRRGSQGGACTGARASSGRYRRLRRSPAILLSRRRRRNVYANAWASARRSTRCEAPVARLPWTSGRQLPSGRAAPTASRARWRSARPGRGRRRRACRRCCAGACGPSTSTAAARPRSACRPCPRRGA